MKINTLFDDISAITFADYLKKCGVEDVDKYLVPDKSCIECAEHYDGMSDGFELLKDYVST